MMKDEVSMIKRDEKRDIKKISCKHKVKSYNPSSKIKRSEIDELTPAKTNFKPTQTYAN